MKTLPMFLAVFLVLAGFCRAQDAPHVLIVIAEVQYETAMTLPPFAEEVLEKELGYTTQILQADPENENVIPGLSEALKKADLLFLSVRRRALPEADLQAVRDYLEAGKPLVGIRTSSHAFDTRGKHPEGHAEWPRCDREVLGCNYTGHTKGGAAPVQVTAAEGVAETGILKGVDVPFTGTAQGGLYNSSPLEEGTTLLLTGSIPESVPEPVAWTNHYGPKKARIFYTSLGHKEDFDQAAFQKLLRNGVSWALGSES